MTDWRALDRGLVLGLFTDVYRRIGGLDLLLQPIDDAVARKNVAEAEWKAEDLLEHIHPRDTPMLERLRRVLNCLKARPPQRALDRLRDLHRRLVRDGVLPPEAVAARGNLAPSAPSPAPPRRKPTAPAPSPAAPSRRPSAPAPSPAVPSRRPSAPAPSPAVPSREPAGPTSDATRPLSPLPPTYLPVPRMSDSPGSQPSSSQDPKGSRSRAPLPEKPPAPAPPSPASDDPAEAPAPFPPGPAGPRHFSVRILLQQKLEVNGFPKAVIAQAMHVCQLAGDLVEDSDASPGAWAAAFAYLGCARSFGTALRQQEAGRLFNVSGATVSIRARQVAEFLDM